MQGREGGKEETREERFKVIIRERGGGSRITRGGSLQVERWGAAERRQIKGENGRDAKVRDESVHLHATGAPAPPAHPCCRAPIQSTFTHLFVFR